MIQSIFIVLKWFLLYVYFNKEKNGPRLKKKNTESQKNH